MTTVAELVMGGQPIPSDIPIISCHTHIGVGWNLPVMDGSGESVLETMDHCGLNISCISSMRSLSADLRGGNEEIARAVESHPERYIGTAVFNPHYPEDSLKELERYFGQPGFGMMKVHPEFHSYAMDGPEYDRAWAFAAERKIPVLVHSWGEGKGVDHPSLAANVAARHPEVRLVLGHSGGTPAGVQAAIAVAREHPNIYLDTATSMAYRGVLEFLTSSVGAERVVFGTDAIYLADAPQIARVAAADIAEGDKHKILGGNLLGLLRNAEVEHLPALEVFS